MTESEPPTVLDPTPVHALASQFLEGQFLDGSYGVGPRVQSHLKAEIGMLLAARATGVPVYGESALRDLKWVMNERLQRDGGLRWDDTSNPYFFAVHQHWFLIASQLIQEAFEPDEGIRSAQRQAWRYLLVGNPSLRDFYLENETRTGAFFAFRDVHEFGWFQTQAPFKGSYEVGAALWSMALLEEEILGLEPGPAGPMSEYLTRLVKQSLRDPSRQGFYDAGTWIRSLSWNGSDWVGYTAHDWKYAPSMQEGALECYRLSARRELLPPIRGELAFLLPRVRANGSVVGIPDGYGSERYEIGLALSTLGLGASVLSALDPPLANRCRAAGAKMYEYAASTFVPLSNEDSAILLAGMARVLEAQQTLAPLQ